MNKSLQALALCKRAGKLIMGSDAVKDAVRQNKARLLAVSSEMSLKAQGEIAFLEERYGVALVTIDVSLDEAWRVLGKRAGIFAITDPSFAKLLNQNTGHAKQEEKE